VKGEETKTKSRMDDETGVMRVGSETICDRSQFGFDSKWHHLDSLNHQKGPGWKSFVVEGWLEWYTVWA